MLDGDVREISLIRPTCKGKGKAEHLYSALHGKDHFKALRHGSHSFTCVCYLPVKQDVMADAKLQARQPSCNQRLKQPPTA